MLWLAEASTPQDQLLIALVGVITAVVALLGYVLHSRLGAIADDTKHVNQAVNNKETGELSLYRLAAVNSQKLDEVMAKQAEFDRRWGNLPPDIGDAVALHELLSNVHRQITEVQAELRQHVAWEMAEKYRKEP